MYSPTVIKVAAKKSFMHISWLVGVIGIPIVFFLDGLSLIEKTGLFLGLLVFFWLLYLALCFALHRFSLRKAEIKADFLALDDSSKGKVVGSYLEGW